MNVPRTASARAGPGFRAKLLEFVRGPKRAIVLNRLSRDLLIFRTFSLIRGPYDPCCR